MRYVWDPFVRIFHWSLVIAVSVAFITRNSEWYRVIHVYAGYSTAALIASRIFWGLGRHGYASFKAFPFDPVSAFRYVWETITGGSKRFVGHNPAGSLVIYMMLMLGLTTVASGFMVFNDGWLFDDSELLQTIHTISAWTWFGLICMHITGVIVESIVHRDNLILAMFTGVKPHSADDTEELDKNVSRETLQTFAHWTLALRRFCRQILSFKRANHNLYEIIEQNDVVKNYGVAAPPVEPHSGSKHNAGDLK